MENNEVMMNEEVEMTNIEDVEIETAEKSGSGLLGKIILGTLAVGAATAVILHKTKDKRKARKIEKLRKEGYVVYMPEEEAVDTVEADFEEVETE